MRKKFPATSFTGSPVFTEAGFDLLNKLLTFDPEKVRLNLVFSIGMLELLALLIQVHNILFRELLLMLP